MSLIDLQYLYEFLKIEREDLIQILHNNQLNILKNVQISFLDNLFLGKNTIDLNQFNEKFQNDNLMWIFDCNGIRDEIERLNN